MARIVLLALPVPQLCARPVAIALLRLLKQHAMLARTVRLAPLFKLRVLLGRTALQRRHSSAAPLLVPIALHHLLLSHHARAAHTAPQLQRSQLALLVSIVRQGRPLSV